VFNYDPTADKFTPAATGEWRQVRGRMPLHRGGEGLHFHCVRETVNDAAAVSQITSVGWGERNPR